MRELVHETRGWAEVWRLVIAPLVLVATPGPAAGSVCGYVTVLTADTVSVIDVATNTVRGDIPLPQPLSIAVSPDGSQAYVTTLKTLGAPAGVSIIDTASNRVTLKLQAGPAPRQVLFAADGTVAFVTQGSDTETLVIVDTATRAVTGHVATGTGAANLRMTLSPDGTRAYVAQLDSNTIAVIDMASFSLLATIPFAVQPRDVAVTQDGRWLLVPTFGRLFTEPSDVLVIDTATHAVSTTVRAENNPTAIALTPDGRFAYVVNAEADSVSVIEIESLSVTTAIPVGRFPGALAFTPDGRFAYVTNAGARSISVIDTAAGAAVATIPVAGTPQYIAIAAVPGDCTAPATPTPTVTDTIPPTPSATPSASPTQTATRTSTRRPTVTRTASPTASATATASPTRSPTCTATRSATVTRARTATATATAPPTRTATATPTETAPPTLPAAGATSSTGCSLEAEPHRSPQALLAWLIAGAVLRRTHRRPAARRYRATSTVLALGALWLSALVGTPVRAESPQTCQLPDATVPASVVYLDESGRPMIPEAWQLRGEGAQPNDAGAAAAAPPPALLDAPGGGKMVVLDERFRSYSVGRRGARGTGRVECTRADQSLDGAP